MSRTIMLLVAASVFLGSVSPVAVADAAVQADVRVDTVRVAGADRYATAAALARVAYPGWSGVRSVIIASGEQAACTDALVASPLTKAAGGPLLLVERDRVPQAAADSLREIAAAETTVTLFVVGGTGAVSEQCVSEVIALLGDRTSARRVSGADRYSTAAAVASLVASLAAGSAEGWRGLVLVANGETRFGLVDALGASAAGAASTAPVLLVQPDTVPAATREALASLAATEVVVVGGRGVVSDASAAAVRASRRWAGADRYATAAAVARNLWARGFAPRGSAIVACSVPDGVAAAQLCAAGSGPLLLAARAGIPAPTAACLTEGSPPVARAVIAGGDAAVPPVVERELRGAPHPPAILSPRSGSLTCAKASIAVRTGVNTRELRLYRGSSLVAVKPAAPFSDVSLGVQAMPPAGTALRVVAVARDGQIAETAARYKRLAYPASTSIVIDKSDFRLYWVKGDILVKAYPIAIGRPHMETPVAMWKIGAKYCTDPAGIYGPRKMRLFRRVVSGDSVRYVYTRYNIHGTNQPWVIGTKASHGCIRMYNRDVLELFPQVPLGTLVQTRE